MLDDLRQDSSVRSIMDLAYHIKAEGMLGNMLLSIECVIARRSYYWKVYIRSSWSGPSGEGYSGNPEGHRQCGMFPSNCQL
jgi:hypothetical protein